VLIGRAAAKSEAQWQAAVSAALAPAQIPATEERWLRHAYIRGEMPRQAAAAMVTIERRLDALPDIPTVGEFLPGYEASNWYGLGAPKNTPAESSRSSTRRSMLALPIPSSGRGFPTWAARCLRAHRDRGNPPSDDRPYT
jgi:Tripartite tricarboxylate transporter family receptor